MNHLRRMPKGPPGAPAQGRDRSGSRPSVTGDRFHTPDKILALIPAYNEAECLPAVLSSLPKGVDVLVVDDGSTDRTSAVAREGGARVISHAENRGQGAALLTGFHAAIEDRYPVVVELDADGQHDPRDIPRLTAKLREGYDVVIGSRYLPFPEEAPDPAPDRPRYAGPLIRRLLLPTFARIFARRAHIATTDPMSGYRAFTRGIIEKAFGNGEAAEEPQYFSMELYRKLQDIGARIGEVPIRIHPRTHGKSKKGFVRYGLGVLRGFASILRAR
ncbi:MAG: glycosyltransferase family 2 protein [Nitrospirae bacterium]|nr:glycosyltransferase family 2 protein [Nitrospirota bacterium]